MDSLILKIMLKLISFLYHDMIAEKKRKKEKKKRERKMQEKHA